MALNKLPAGRKKLSEKISSDSNQNLSASNVSDLGIKSKGNEKIVRKSYDKENSSVIQEEKVSLPKNKSLASTKKDAS